MATVHPNYIKSSNIIILSILIDLLNLAFSQTPLNTPQFIGAFLMTILFLAAIAFLVRKGLSWMKYVLLVLSIIGIVGLAMIILKNPVFNGVLVVNIVQTLLQLWALIILFTIPKSAGTVAGKKNNSVS
jgi:glucan phosphoethanolaminetransferase (alkaline phosphatase superfamily)